MGIDQVGFCLDGLKVFLCIFVLPEYQNSAPQLFDFRSLISSINSTVSKNQYICQSLTTQQFKSASVCPAKIVSYRRLELLTTKKKKINFFKYRKSYLQWFIFCI